MCMRTTTNDARHGFPGFRGARRAAAVVVLAGATLGLGVAGASAAQTSQPTGSVGTTPTCVFPPP
jgi:hypothetical protein